MKIMVKELEVPKKSSGSKVVVLCLLLLLVTMSYCTYSVYRGFADFPEWAEEEVAYARYGDLIASVEAEIQSSTSLYDLAAKLEKLPGASEILYMEIEHLPGNKDEDDSSFIDEEELVVIDDDNSSHSYFLNGSTGYGHRNGIETVVIMLDVEHLPEVNHVLFHLVYKPQG